MADPEASISFFSLTAGGSLLALKLRDQFGGTAHLPRCHSLGCRRCSPFDSVSEVLPERFQAGDAVVCIMAAGIVFRILAPFLKSKHDDPAVVVVDEEGRFAVPLLGGHAAGANRLAGEIAAFLGGEAVLTTSSDVQGLMAPDEVARTLGARIESDTDLRKLTGMLVNGAHICIEADSDPGIDGYQWVPIGHPSPACAGRLLVSHQAGFEEGGLPTARLVPQRAVIGIGCRRGTPAAEIVAAARDACTEAGIDPLAIGKLASVSLKEDEAGLAEAAGMLGVGLGFFSPDELAQVGAAGSDFVREQVGTPAVCEPAAILAAGHEGELLAGKRVRGRVTTAVALAPGSFTVPDTGAREGSLAVVGLGAGTSQLLTDEAANALAAADTVIGYRTYVEQVRELYPGKEYIAGAMGAELDRCRKALELARTGRRVALVSSGDPGIYGMAGPLIELADGYPVDVFPGVTAAQIAAARLGAPLMNDYISLSLSDLLTPRDEVLRRTAAAAASDMVICLYNPVSRKRRPLFEKACAIIGQHRAPDTVVGIVRKAGAVDESVAIITLAELALQEVDMRSIVIIGSSHTQLIDGRMVTTRGYAAKGVHGDCR